jgi:hypothetical protein
MFERQRILMFKPPTDFDVRAPTDFDLRAPGADRTALRSAEGAQYESQGQVRSEASTSPLEKSPKPQSRPEGPK